jgi:hypothetical protein
VFLAAEIPLHPSDLIFVIFVSLPVPEAWRGSCPLVFLAAEILLHLCDLVSVLFVSTCP